MRGLWLHCDFTTPPLHYLTLPYLTLPCLALPCLALPCLALPCLALPCLALPCLALPLALPCLALPCLALPCLAINMVITWSSHGCYCVVARSLHGCSLGPTLSCHCRRRALSGFHPCANQRWSKTHQCLHANHNWDSTSKACPRTSVVACVSRGERSRVPFRPRKFGRFKAGCAVPSSTAVAAGLMRVR